MVTEGERSTVALSRQRQRRHWTSIICSSSQTQSNRTDARVSIPSARRYPLYFRDPRIHNVETKRKLCTYTYTHTHERLRRWKKNEERANGAGYAQRWDRKSGQWEKEFGFSKRIATPWTRGMRRYPHKTSKLRREWLKLFRRPRRRGESFSVLPLDPSTISARKISSRSCVPFRLPRPIYPTDCLPTDNKLHSDAVSFWPTLILSARYFVSFVSPWSSFLSLSVYDFYFSSIFHNTSYRVCARARSV